MRCVVGYDSVQAIIHASKERYEIDCHLLDVAVAQDCNVAFAYVLFRCFCSCFCGGRAAALLATFPLKTPAQKKTQITNTNSHWRSHIKNKADGASFDIDGVEVDAFAPDGRLIQTWLARDAMDFERAMLEGHGLSGGTAAGAGVLASP